MVGYQRGGGSPPLYMLSFSNGVLLDSNIEKSMVPDGRDDAVGLCGVGAMPARILRLPRWQGAICKLRYHTCLFPAAASTTISSS